MNHVHNSFTQDVENFGEEVKRTTHLWTFYSCLLTLRAVGVLPGLEKDISEDFRDKKKRRKKEKRVCVYQNRLRKP